MEKLHIGILGTGGAGKSSIAMRYISNEFTEGYVPTVYDEWSKTTKIKQTNEDDGIEIELLFMDSSGQEEFNYRHNISSRCDCLIIVIDITNGSSLEEAKDVYQEALISFSRNVICAIALNKYDLYDSQKKTHLNTHSESKKWADEIKWRLYETSAKTNLNIQNMLEDIINAAYDLKQKEKSASKKTVGGCCLIY